MHLSSTATTSSARSRLSKAIHGNPKRLGRGPRDGVCRWTGMIQKEAPMKQQVARLAYLLKRSLWGGGSRLDHPESHRTPPRRDANLINHYVPSGPSGPSAPRGQ